METQPKTWICKKCHQIILTRLTLPIIATEAGRKPCPKAILRRHILNVVRHSPTTTPVG